MADLPEPLRGSHNLILTVARIQALNAYNSNGWRKIRKLVIAKNPLCELCETELATHVHHLDFDYRNNNISNLQALCSPCHMRLHKKK